MEFFGRIIADPLRAVGRASDRRSVKISKDEGTRGLCAVMAMTTNICECAGQVTRERNMTLYDYKVNTKGFLKLFMLTCLAFALLSCFAEEAYADIPSVLQIENLSQGSLGKIRIHVRHANPSSGHYVDQLEIFGRSGGQSLTKILTLQPQSGNPFTVEASEEVPGSYLINAYVKVRARCNLHGWSNWSDEVQVPEFRELASIVLVAMAVSMLLLRKRS